jgi:uncharacterized DUF497 family protein
LLGQHFDNKNDNIYAHNTTLKDANDVFWNLLKKREKKSKREKNKEKRRKAELSLGFS